MNILLLNPPSKDTSWYRAEHLGLAYLAASLRQVGHRVKILDAFLENFDVDKTIKAILSLEDTINILGITATEPQTLFSGIRIVNKLQQNGINPHVTAGGYLPTFWSEEVLIKFPEIDSLVLGEGEQTITELVDALQKGRELRDIPGLALQDEQGHVFHTEKRSLIANLDALPFPARDYLSVAYQKYHHALVYSSRGCYHKCSFCQIAQFYRLSTGSPYRSRSVKNIADEIEILVKKHGVRSVFFVDDEFITESSKRIKIIEELIHEIDKRQLKFNFSIQYRADTGTREELLKKLKSIGLNTVFVGVESGVDRVLERFDKGIDKADIQTALQLIEDFSFNKNIGYILFNPGTTYNELRESITYLLTPKAPTLIKLIGMMVLKGTPENNTLKAENSSLKRDFSIRYPIKDKKVAAFASMVKRYYPIYEPVAKDYYELHFLIGDLSENESQQILKRVKVVEKNIRNLHQLFLSRALEELDQDQAINNNNWVDELRNPFIPLHVQTQQILQDGIRLIEADK
jgi:anaerobic magnesium-protoporphyrin IX monomethyl ester cyclase